ncbi:hypothetical protein C8J56DRAFT_886607 [Mycena floridula]|nr:hypothetical protein C8J56DRAFT_886607 [Mycena floridula]
MSPVTQSRLAFRKSRIASAASKSSGAKAHAEINRLKSASLRGWHVSLSTWSDALRILPSSDNTMARLGLPSFYHTYQTRKNQEIGWPRHRGQGKQGSRQHGGHHGRRLQMCPLHFSAEVPVFGLAFAEVCRYIPRRLPRRRCRRMLSAQMTVVEGDRGGDVGGMAYGDVTAERYSGYRSASRCWSRLESLKGHREIEDSLIQGTFLSIESGKTRVSTSLKISLTRYIAIGAVRHSSQWFLVQTALAGSENAYTS